MTRVLVTGSRGHLGDALCRTLGSLGHDVVGMDILDGASITDRFSVRDRLAGVQCVLHTATLHKPHIVTHDAQRFIDTNITGTLILLEESVRAGVASFVYTSTTSVFGRALSGWITENVIPIPKNIYGVTKRAAEDVCEMVHARERLSCIILRTSRFFPEEDDDSAAREAYAPDNLKANEYLYRRVDIEDVVSAHLLAMDRRMLPTIDRVYDNARARTALGWRPRYDFRSVIAQDDIRSPLARLVGSKGYHTV